MAEKFDPYYQWLGIAATDRPIHHYSLLGLKPFETDSVVIRVAADRQMAHLRTFQNGPHAVESQQLLNEIAQARICLLDSVRKAAYDKQLRAQLGIDVGQDSPAARVKIEVDSSGSAREPVRLYRPGRGPRDRGTDRRLVMGATIVTLLLVGVAAYSVSKRLRPPPIADLNSQAAPESDSRPPLLPPPVPAEQPESAVDTSQLPRPDTATAAAPPEVATPSADEPGSTTETPSRPDKAPAVASADEPEVPNRGATPASDTASETRRPTPSSTASPRTRGNLWDEATLKVSGSPRQFSTATPAGDLLTRLASRDVAQAKEVLKGWKPATGTPPVSDDIYADGALVYDGVRSFWTLVTEGLAELKNGDRLQCREYLGKVVNVSERELQLEAPTGKIESFDTRPAHISRDLAISVAAHRLRTSSTAAWRAIGIFLAIDRDGDVDLSRHFSHRAEQHGLDVDYFFERWRLQGDASVPFVMQPDEQKAGDGAPGAG